MLSYCGMFLPVQEGGYAITFPDIPEIVSGGKDIDECLDMAEDALAYMIKAYTRQNKAFPTPSTFDNVMAQARKEMAQDDNGLDASREPIVQMFRVPVPDTTPVRISATIARDVLAAIDRKAGLFGMSRSRFLTTAAMAYNG